MTNVSDKKAREALRRAKKLEEHELLTTEQITKVHSEATTLSERLKKLLRPSWFVSDRDRASRRKRGKV